MALVVAPVEVLRRDGWRFIQDSSQRDVPERVRQAILSIIWLAAGGDERGGGAAQRTRVSRTATHAPSI